MDAQELLWIIRQKGIVAFALNDLDFVDIQPIEKIWLVGELSANGSIQITDGIDKYVVVVSNNGVNADQRMEEEYK